MWQSESFWMRRNARRLPRRERQSAKYVCDKVQVDLKLLIDECEREKWMGVRQQEVKGERNQQTVVLRPLHTESVFFRYPLQIRDPKKKNVTHRNLAHRVQCVCSSILPKPSVRTQNRSRICFYWVSNCKILFATLVCTVQMLCGFYIKLYSHIVQHSENLSIILVLWCTFLMK